MTDLIDSLKKEIKGEVRSDPVSRTVYSVDASIYEVQPEVIVIPKDKEDVLTAIQIAKTYHVPITPRGAATGITGGCLGSGLILDLSKYLNRILEINYEAQYALCEPGVIQNQLNAALCSRGFRLGPDTSTGDRATLGGMLANNAAGAHSLKYGTMADHVLSVELALSSGELSLFGSDTSAKHPLVLQLIQIANRYQKEIETHFPKIPRRVSGYNLDALLGQGGPDLPKLIAGSEGTLGVATAIKMNISPQLKHTALSIIHFDDLIGGLKAMDKILSFSPIAVEMIDDKIIHAGRLSPHTANKLSWIQGHPKIVLAVEFEGETPSSLERPLKALSKESIGYAQVQLIDKKRQEEVWEVRKAGLGLLLSKRSYSRAIAFIEDITVPPMRLAPFMEEFLLLLKRRNKEAGIYGHAGAGCLHIRPYIDLRDPKERETMQALLEETTELVLKYGGSLSGEHGDGRVRSWLNPKLFGKLIAQAFLEVKQAFDPDNLMNPGKIVQGTPFLEHLRLSPETPLFEPKTFLDFSREGGIGLAADLCNGNGLCRKKEKTMCPSFQVTEDEYHTTRARAQTLRGIMHGVLPQEEWTGEGLYEVLDLCLQCKGCKTECPSQVDMAKMKSEFLYHYHNKHGISIRDRMFGYVGTLNRIISPFAPVANALFRSSFFKTIQSKFGIAAERTLPYLAKGRFSSWFQKHLSPTGNPVVLFNDTFTEFHCPEVGRAAVQALEALGYRVIVPPWRCCGRTLISKGMLKPAKNYAERLIKSLLPYAKEKIPVIGLEPSCLLTLKDDYQGLLGYGNKELDQVVAASHLFDAFLATHEKLPFKPINEEILFHGHCHQKALEKTPSSIPILSSLGKVTEIPSGCCGMAGAFGYEKEHYTLSMQIGDLKLFPIIRGSSTALLIANGFSCRCQIEHATGRRAFHLTEVLTSL